jgi:hypothetical protein
MTKYRSSSNLSDAQAALDSTLEEFGFADITLHMSKARKQKKSKLSQRADLRQWLIPSVLVGWIDYLDRTRTIRTD